MTRANPTDAEVIGAMRLAQTAANNGSTLVMLFEALLEKAPPSDPASTDSTWLLIDTVTSSEGNFVLASA